MTSEQIERLYSLFKTVIIKNTDARRISCCQQTFDSHKRFSVQQHLQVSSPPLCVLKADRRFSHDGELNEETLPPYYSYGGAFVFAFLWLCMQSGEPGTQPGCFLPLSGARRRESEGERRELLSHEWMSRRDINK